MELGNSVETKKAGTPKGVQLFLFLVLESIDSSYFIEPNIALIDAGRSPGRRTIFEF